MKCAMTLIECMIYLALLILISGAACVWIARITHLYKVDDQELVLHLAHDLLYKDVASGSVDSQEWSIAENKLVINAPQQKITWQITSGKRLVRSVDQFDTRKNEWIHTRSALVAHPVDRLTLSLGGTGNERTAHVALHGVYKKKPYTITTVIPLHAGQLL